jgi:hypothetical protein
MSTLYQKPDKRIYKKCIKCREWKPRKDILDDSFFVTEKHGFGKHSDSSDGLQSICYACKNIMNNKARDKNVRVRIRHHTATRCLTQLGKPLTPENFVTNLEDYLGYRISDLVRHLAADLRKREGPRRKLKDALNEGYHIDHIRPLSLYPVVRKVRGTTEKGTTEKEEVDWDQFRACWKISNLTAIPGQENLQKGAKYEG